MRFIEMISWDLIVLTGVSWDVSHWNWSELWEFDSRGFGPPNLFHTFFRATNWRVQLRATPKPLPPVSNLAARRLHGLEDVDPLTGQEANLCIGMKPKELWHLWWEAFFDEPRGDMLEICWIPNFGFEKYDIPRLWLIGCVDHLQLQFQSAPGS